MSESRGIVKNLTSMTTMRLLSAALSFLLIVSIARTMGTVPLGKFSLLFSYFIFLQQMPLLGLHLVAIRDVAANPGSMPAHAVNMTAIATVVAILLALALGIIGGHIYRDDGEMANGMWLVALSVVPTGFICVVESILIGQQRMHIVAGWNVAENIIRTAASFLVLWLGMGIPAVFLMFVLARLVIASGYWKAIRFTELAKDARMAWSAIREYLCQVPVFFGIMLCSAAINRLDFLMLSSLGTLHDVGIYSAPYKVYEVALMAPSLITIVLLPVFSRAYQAPQDSFGQLLEATMRIVLTAAIPCIGLGIFLAPQIMWLFGAQYVDAAWILQILLVGVAFVSINQLFSLTMVVSHNQQLDFKALAWSCVAYAFLLAVSIPTSGVTGAALSTFAVTVLQPLLRFAFLRKTICLQGLGRVSLAMLFAALAMFAGFFAAARISPFFGAVAGMGAYAAAIWFLKALPRDMLGDYRRLMMRRGG